jgi:hypothetical protein
MSHSYIKYLIMFLLLTLYRKDLFSHVYTLPLVCFFSHYQLLTAANQPTDLVSWYLYPSPQSDWIVTEPFDWAKI